MRTIPHRLAPYFIVLLFGIGLSSIQVVNADTVFFDGFDDPSNRGDTVTWRPVPEWYPKGVAEMLGGQMRFIPGDIDNPPIFDIYDAVLVAEDQFTLDDVSVRVGIQLVNGTPADFIGIQARRDNETNSGYSAAIRPSGELLIVREPSSIILGTEWIPINVAEQEVILQFDAFGDELSLSAWLPGEEMPEDPQLAVIDDGPLENGIISLWSWPADSIDGVGIFSFVHVADSPIPDHVTDFNSDGLLNVPDVDELIRYFGTASSRHDRTKDGNVDFADLRSWIHDDFGTSFGDANLDGVFDSGDLVDVFVAGKYVVDPDIAATATWAEGDWNGDMLFDSGDLVLAFEDGGYVTGAAPAVPEPTSVVMVIGGAIGLVTVLRTRRRSTTGCFAAPLWTSHLESSSIHRLPWLISFVLMSCLVSGRLQAQQMIFPGETWQVATPESVLIDSQKLDAAVAELATKVNSIEEMVVVRNGRVIWQGSNIGHSQHVFSVTKTFASTALGLLIDDGRVSLDTLASDYVPSMAADYGQATLRHFITQTSGYVAENERLQGGGTPPADVFSPGKPLFSPSGSQFAYTGAAMDMLANTLTRAAEEPLQDLFTRRIAEPIAMDLNYFDWNEFVADDGVVVDGGSGYVDRGVVISPGNLARLGQLFLNRGQWNDQQLISSDWVDASTQVQVASIPVHRLSATGGPGLYGYGWWVFSDWYHALGAGANSLSINPTVGLVIARLGQSGAEADAVRQFEAKVANAVMPAVWDQNGDGRWDDLDSATGKPRWRTGSGDTPDIYPTGEAIIRSDMVTVANDLRTGKFSVESGGVKVNRSASLSASRFNVERGAVLDVEGIVQATVATIDGLMDVDGSANFLRLGINQGKVNIHPGAIGEIARVTQTGGKFIINGDLKLGRLKVTDGHVEVHPGQLPYAIDRFELFGDTEIRFLVGDSWSSPIKLEQGEVPILTGNLVVDVAAADDPQQLVGQTVNLFDWSKDVVPEGAFADIVSPSRMQWDVSRFYETGEVVLQSALDKPLKEGDFSGNGTLDHWDIDQLTRRTRVLSPDNYFDVNSDGSVTQQDVDYWVHDLANTYFGDSNLDGEFNSGDLVEVFSAGEYEDRLTTNSTWATGDWNGDGDFTTSDLVVAIQDGGYERRRFPAMGLVPEPATIVMLTAALIGIAIRRRY